MRACPKLPRHVSYKSPIEVALDVGTKLSFFMMAIAMAAQAHFHWTIFLTTYTMLATKVILGRAQFLNKNYSQSGFDFQVNFHDNCKENY
jgi:hypothetical protein